MRNQHRPFQLLWMASFMAFMGVFSFFSVASNPRFETIHVLDMIRLMTAGAGFALALFMLKLFFRGHRFVDNRAGGKSGEESNDLTASGRETPAGQGKHL